MVPGPGFFIFRSPSSFFPRFFQFSVSLALQFFSLRLQKDGAQCAVDSVGSSGGLGSIRSTRWQNWGLRIHGYSASAHRVRVDFGWILGRR